ncbi:ATP-binding protein [Streptomyces nojiriensis]|uniref:histidine kinase n=1 Tax=Streptomyces nojiriensis TaxID=66374 RepID=A0ABQ3SWF6_9ACTN|nr:ATP-binding protein [Streptomyces nojiriensis]QTI46009.1 Sensor protein CseC [Streptomyces nojiriensis]GGR88813.1 two-component sensor histidine kinase [Streptomyces nojiriensis]GHI72483.1 two-component sensor histidine kinase [Streptomyces nojiriensis]
MNDTQRDERLRPRPRLPAWTSTLTWKATVFITLMCCGLAALLGCLVHGAMTRQTVGAAREKALTRLERSIEAYETGGRMPRGEGIDPAGLPPELRALAVGGRRGTAVGRYRNRPVMWAAGPAAHGSVIAVSVDFRASERTIAELDRAILGSSALAIGGTLLIGALVVTRITRRLHLTAQVARRISAGDLDARVDDRTGSKDEVAAVSRALDTMASSLQGKLEAEQRFTADVAHELRTPLTGLNAAAELLPPGRPAELVRDRVRAMRSLTEDLLEISRLETRGERLELDSYDLADLAARAIRASGTDTALEVHEVRGSRGSLRGERVETDRRRLERILGNLVANAHSHGAAPVTLTVEGRTLTVTDAGPGYPEYVLTAGPQRFRTEGTSKGHGLGLTIAAAQARVLGATLTFRNREAGGAEARVTLPGPAGPGATALPRRRDELPAPGSSVPPAR